MKDTFLFIPLPTKIFHFFLLGISLSLSLSLLVRKFQITPDTINSMDNECKRCEAQFFPLFILFRFAFLVFSPEVIFLLSSPLLIPLCHFSTSIVIFLNALAFFHIHVFTPSSTVNSITFTSKENFLKKVRREKERMIEKERNGGE